jgi:hypothetical protein
LPGGLTQSQFGEGKLQEGREGRDLQYRGGDVPQAWGQPNDLGTQNDFAKDDWAASQFGEQRLPEGGRFPLQNQPPGRAREVWGDGLGFGSKNSFGADDDADVRAWPGVNDRNSFNSAYHQATADQRSSLERLWRKKGGFK